MNWFQRLIKRATQRLVPFTESAIRQAHTIHFDLWDYTATDDRPPRRRWNNKTLTKIQPSSRDALKAYIRESHIPPGRSSLSVVEAFIIAATCFNEEQYDVYIAAGATEWVKPLIGSDAVVVFERIDAAALAAQPFVAGDTVLFNWHDTAVLHLLTTIDQTKQQFFTRAGYPIPLEAIHSRLAAVIYTQPPHNLDIVLPAEPDHHPIAVDLWSDTLFRPQTAADKPSPHSAITTDSTNRADWPLLRRLMSDINGGVWDTIANTNSMEPFLDAGTVLLYERLTPEKLAETPLHTGDIVNWGTPDLGRLHRIIGRGSNQTYYIKGDNNPIIDHIHGNQAINSSIIRHRIVGVIYTQQQRPND